MDDFPASTHQAAREGWRVRAMCACGRTGLIQPDTLLAYPDRSTLDMRLRCPRDGCRKFVSAGLVWPGWEPPKPLNLPERDSAYKPRRSKLNAMLAGILDPTARAQVEREQAEWRAAQSKEPAP